MGSIWFCTQLISMEKTVEDYIKKQLSKGVPLQKIKKALIDVGHDVNMVEKKVKDEEEYLLRERIKKDKHTDKKLDLELLHYIKVGMKLGKELDDISKELLVAGHDINKIKVHIDHVKSKQSTTVKLLGFSITIIFILAIGALALFFLSPSSSVQEPEPLLNEHEKCLMDCSDNFCITKCNNDNHLVKALADVDKDRCDQITDEAMKTSCNDLIIRKLATNERNPELCSQISREDIAESCKNVALQSIALLEKNMSMCYDITDVSMRNGCVDNFRLNTAVEQDNMSICDLISEDDNAIRCRDSVLRNRAFTSGNTSICDSITDLSFKQKCKGDLG